MKENTWLVDDSKFPENSTSHRFNSVAAPICEEEPTIDSARRIIESTFQNDPHLLQAILLKFGLEEREEDSEGLSYSELAMKLGLKSKEQAYNLVQNALRKLSGRSR